MKVLLIVGLLAVSGTALARRILSHGTYTPGPNLTCTRAGDSRVGVMGSPDSGGRRTCYIGVAVPPSDSKLKVPSSAQ